MGVGFPDQQGNFSIDLAPGKYALRAYHNGEPIGAELEVNITPAPAEQLLREPLKVSEPSESKDKKEDTEGKK
jgi:hypothetical protein